MTAMEHVRYLVEQIGPRGSTRGGERAAARYAADVLRGLGQEPVTEPFTSARSKYQPYALSTGLGLVGIVLFWLGSSPIILITIALQMLNLISVLLHLCSVSNPLRWVLPKGESQNVYTRIRALGTVRCRVVLLAHLDSNRAPLLNANSTWLRIYRWLMPASLLSGVLLLVLLLLGMTNPAPVLRVLAILPGLVLLAVFLLMIQADLTPFTVGANDNASSVGVTLSLARRLVQQPLANTEVWPLLDGCEEVSLYGADAFARRHGAELHDALWIVLDSIGGSGGVLRYTESETLLLTIRSDPELLRLFDGVASAQPELGARRLRFQTGANATDGTMLGRHGLRQIAVVAPGPHGSELLQIHRTTDDLPHLDPDLVGRCESLIWYVLQAVDAQDPA